jgi:transposase InsO family protein
VNLHPNAKTTPRTRKLIIERVQHEGWDVESVAEAAGVSTRTVWKWVRRYREEGLDGLDDRPCKLHRSPSSTPPSLVRRIEKLRRQRMAAFAIARTLGMARSTVCAVLVRLGLNRRRVLEPKEPANRYERARPGELIHLDIKKLGKIKRIGKRIHGDRSIRSRGAGWEFVHVCIDDHSRVSYVEILADERKETAAGFLKRAVAWFAELGVRVERVLTDNGSCYVSAHFRETCAELGVTPKRTRPYRPRTNGKAERLIQTLLREWAYAKPYHTSGWRQRALKTWVRFYNNVRPHGSLGGRPPATRIGVAG